MIMFCDSLNVNDSRASRCLANSCPLSWAVIASLPCMHLVSIAICAWSSRISWSFCSSLSAADRAVIIEWWIAVGWTSIWLCCGDFNFMGVGGRGVLSFLIEGAGLGWAGLGWAGLGLGLGWGWGWGWAGLGWGLDCSGGRWSPYWRTKKWVGNQEMSDKPRNEWQFAPTSATKKKLKCFFW